ALTHVLDAEGKQEALQGSLLAVFDRGNQVARPLARDLAGLDRLRRRAIAFVGTTLHLDEILDAESIEIGDRDHEAEVAKILDQPRSESLDIHGPTRGKMDDRFLALRRAGQFPGTTPHHLAFLAHKFRVADRATGRHAPGLRAGG